MIKYLANPRIYVPLMCALIGLYWAIAIAIGHTARAQSGVHGDGQAEQHDIYRHWHPPLNPGSSCCTAQSADDPLGDRRPTRAYIDPELGLWRAWNGSAWLVVPQDRVLPSDYAGDGRSHLCEKAGFVYCFAPGEIRSRPKSQ